MPSPVILVYNLTSACV